MAFRKTIVATGTRGLFGFKHQGQFSLAYNHFDSDPDCLGGRLAYEVNEMVRMNKIPQNLKKFKKKKLKVIGDNNEEVVPTAKDIEKLKPYTNLAVNKQSTNDWYCLTHKCQGSFKRVLDSGYLLLNSRTPTDKESWTEFNYVLNFDDNTFDFYENNEFKESFPFDKLPSWSHDPDAFASDELKMEKLYEEFSNVSRRRMN